VGEYAQMNSIKWDGKTIYPSKIVCIGRNYADHIKELDNQASQEPVIFIKPNSAISNDIHSIKKEVVHFEGEITFLISAGEFSGVGFGLDLTKREVQSKLKAKGLPWERAKSFNKSAVFSEFVSFNGDISDLRLELYINDSLVQKGSYELMLNKPDQILAEVKGFLSLEDGIELVSFLAKFRVLQLLSLFFFGGQMFIRNFLVPVV